MLKVFQVWENDGGGVHDTVILNLLDKEEAEKAAREAFGGRVTELTVYATIAETPQGRKATLQKSIDAKLSKAGLTFEELAFLKTGKI